MPKINQAKLSNYEVVEIEDPATHLYYEFKLTKELKKEKAPRRSIFKLHLNLSDMSFSRHHEEIADYLDKISPSRIFFGFKYSKETADEIRNGEYYQSYLLLKDLCHLLRENKITDIEFEEKSESIKMIEVKNIALEMAERKRLGKLDQKDIDDNLKNAETELRREERVCGQAQFTLYLLQNVNESKLSLICSILNRHLYKVIAQPGTFSPSDLPVTPFISFRQERMTPKDDYVAYEILPSLEKQTLLQSAKDSNLYNQLIKETKMDSEILAVIDNEIKVSTPTVIGLIAAKLAYRRTSPIQHSMDNAIKNLGHINNMHEFLEFKSDNVPSLKEVLSRANAAEKQQQTAWQKIEEIFKRYHLNTPQAPPPQPRRPF